MSVYFVTCREANAVKIGSSVDPWGRLPEIQWGCPLLVTLEAVMPGDASEEARLHRWFAADRMRGEWFTLTPAIETLIVNNRATDQPDKAGRTIPRKRSQKPMPYASRVPLGMNSDLDWKRYAAALAETRAEQERALNLQPPVPESRVA